MNLSLKSIAKSHLSSYGMNGRFPKRQPLQLRSPNNTTINPHTLMKILQNTNNKNHQSESGKVGWALLWLIGVPLPVLLILYYVFGGK